MYIGNFRTKSYISHRDNGGGGGGNSVNNNKNTKTNGNSNGTANSSGADLNETFENSDQHNSVDNHTTKNFRRLG